MAKYTQASRPLAITTPLGTDALLLETFSGTESLNEPFLFLVEMLAETTKSIAFDKVLGQKVAVRVGNEDTTPRWFHGIVSRLTEGRVIRGVEAESQFIRYRAEIVPQFALLRHRVQSRIFQQMSVPDILKKVLVGFEVSYQLQGQFQPRDYCVQYRESDFAFASRLMEDEGIWYYFKHTQSSHQMIVGNASAGHADVPGKSPCIYEDTAHSAKLDQRVFAWEKTQEIRPAKVTLRDHTFEKPDDNLQAVQPTTAAVKAGTIDHKLKLAVNETLEVYDFPGGYAGRFDGVAPGGSARAGDLAKITPDGERTVKLRMAESAGSGLSIAGAGDYRAFSAGHKFTLSKHPTGDGAYVLGRVEHSASIEGTYTSQDETPLVYRNNFRCQPAVVLFTPPRTTPKPSIDGTQTALVVGTAGQEIFTDKYGRIKVQFYWDRLGKKDANSSCWIRVATSWAGQQWGAIHIPRIGQEVVVAFEEGDPDQPIVVGSVYNASQMPPFPLPDEATRSGLRTRSTLKGTAENCNELRFEDKKGSEDVFFHAEKDFHREVENDDDLKVGHNQTIEVKNDRTETVTEGNESVSIKKGNRTILVETGNDKHTVKTGNRDVIIETGNDTHQIKKGNRTVEIDLGNDSLTIKTGNQTIKLNAGASSTEAMQKIELKVGQNSVTIDQSGVTIKGLNITIQGQVMLDAKAAMTTVSADGVLTLKGGVVKIN